MAKIKKILSEEGNLVYPATITDAIKDINQNKTQAQINQEIRQGIVELTSAVEGFKFRAVYEGNTYKIQQSVNNGSTWTDLTELIVKNIYIAKYFEEDEELDSTDLALGTVVAKTLYDEEDTDHENPKYELYCYTENSSGVVGFVDFGEFTSLTAGIVDEPGFRSDVVMSQSAVTSYYGYIENNPEYIRAVIDSEGHLLCGIKEDGSIEWQKGIPTPVQEKFDEIDATLNTVSTLEEAVNKNCVGIELDKTKGKLMAKCDAHSAAFQSGTIDQRTGKVRLTFNY